jgi:methyl-accepting chemotaxis protein
MDLSNISFKKIIIILLTFPFLGFALLSFISLSSNISTSREMSTLTELTQLSVIYSDLVHELQKERGMTAGFIGSKGEKFTLKLKNQRRQTTEKINVKNSYGQKNTLKIVTIKQLNQAINNSLNELQSIRKRVDDLSITLPDALSFYTQLNAKLLSVASLNAEISSNAVITKETIAYYNFLQGKERAGIERAVLSNTFSKNAFDQGMFAKFISLTTEQKSYFSNFNTFSNPQNRTFFNEQLNHPAVKQVKKLRDIALNNTVDFNVDAEFWFEQATVRIVQLKKIETKLGENLLSLAQELNDSAFNALVVNSIFSAALIIFVISFSVFVIKDQNARVKDLMSVMVRVRDNNDLTAQTSMHGNSELGQISSALNLTLGKFSGAISEISHSSITLASAAEQTSRTCEQNLSSMLDQQNGIGLIATAIEELSVTVKEVATNTQMTADSSQEADKKAKDGLDIVQKSYQSIEKLAAEIDNLATQINNLHESSRNITSVVDVIKSVAEQTNLLALNAAIEAARAGEQGRGFAVVADEVRTLAQRTQQSTAEIENFIITLQSDASSAFNVIEDSQQRAEEAVNDSKVVENTLEDITSAVSNIYSMTEQIATALEEQSVVTQDVAKNVVTIEETSMEATTGATEIATTSKEQAQLATTLQDIANTFKI